MELSSDLVSQFVKVTKDEVNEKNESTFYGTIVTNGEEKFVQLDGSDLLTPIATTTDTSSGDRVTVMIKDHSATVTGNLTDPSAGTERVRDIGDKVTQVETLVADKVDTIVLEAELANIDELYAKKAQIEELEAKNVIITGKLEANEASINDLEANTIKVGEIEGAEGKFNYLKAENLDAKYAEIDLANVNNAWIQNGVIKDASIADEKVISVSANKLTAGEIDASKIIVTNLNADNLTVGTINGKMIGNESVTLDKLSEEVPTKAYLDSVQDNLQGQIDGNIETWTSDEVPTLNNYPAVNWEAKEAELKYTWGQTSLPSAGDWYSIAYGNGTFVAVAYGSDVAAYSTDGETWTATTLPTSAIWYSVTYGDGKFVAVSLNSDSAAYSTDGITWTAATMPSSDNWASVSYGNGKFVAVTHGSNVAAYSTDGNNWTQTTLPASSDWQSVAYGNGKFVAVAYSSDVAAYSTDGVTWTSATMPSSSAWYSVTYGTDRFVAIAIGSGTAAYSTDGITWIECSMPTAAQWSSVTYGDGKFVAVTYESDISAYSEDGVTWIQDTLPASASWKSIAYGNSKFIAVAEYSEVAARYSLQQYAEATASNYKKHVGDVLYVVNSASSADGYCYRFTENSDGTYSWTLIKDSDVTAALQRLIDAEGDISGLKTFETTTSKWISDTDEALKTTYVTTTKLEDKLGNYVNSSTFNEKVESAVENSATITNLTEKMDIDPETGEAFTTLRNSVNEVKQSTDENLSKISSLEKTVNGDGETVGLASRTNTIEQTADSLSSQITTLEEDVNGKLTALETSVAQNTNAIELKASKTEAQEYATSSASSALADAKTYADNSSSTAASSALADAKTYADNSSSTAASSALADAKTYVNSQGYLTVSSDAITSKVSKTEIIAAINDSTETATINADKLSISGSGDLEGRVTALETSVSQNAEAIELKASKTEAQGYADTALGDAKTYVDSQGYLTVTSEAITSKVSKDSVISEINQSAEEIKISADKIEIDGVATFVNTNYIDPVKTTAENANTAAEEAKALVDGAMQESDYCTTETTTSVSIVSGNISRYFTVSNGPYYFAGSGSIFTSNNGGINSSTATTKLTAKYDMSAVSFDYSYSSESKYDKFTLVVAGTTVERAVSGATTNKTWSGTLHEGQTIEFTYAKDNSTNSNDDKCTFSNMKITTSTAITSTVIDGGTIATNSVTADKINVTDLFAKNMTATGTINFYNKDDSSTNHHSNYQLYADGSGNMTIKAWDTLLLKGGGDVTISNNVGYIYFSSPGKVIISADDLVYKDFSGDTAVYYPYLNTHNLTDHISDYVTSQGHSNGFYYRIWSSGTKECWGTISVSNATFTSWGNMYVSWNCIPSQTYPVSFTSAPVVTSGIATSDGNCWLITGDTAASKSKSPSFSIGRGTDYTSDPIVYIHAIGA